MTRRVVVVVLFLSLCAKSEPANESSTIESSLCVGSVCCRIRGPAPCASLLESVQELRLPSRTQVPEICGGSCVSEVVDALHGSKACPAKVVYGVHKVMEALCRKLGQVGEGRPHCMEDFIREGEHLRRVMASFPPTHNLSQPIILQLPLTTASNPPKRLSPDGTFMLSMCETLGDTCIAAGLEVEQWLNYHRRIRQDGEQTKGKGRVPLLVYPGEFYDTVRRFGCHGIDVGEGVGRERLWCWRSVLEAMQNMPHVVAKLIDTPQEFCKDPCQPMALQEVLRIRRSILPLASDAALQASGRHRPSESTLILSEAEADALIPLADSACGHKLAKDKSCSTMVAPLLFPQAMGGSSESTMMPSDAARELWTHQGVFAVGNGTTADGEVCGVISAAQQEMGCCTGAALAVRHRVSDAAHDMWKGTFAEEATTTELQRTYGGCVCQESYTWREKEYSGRRKADALGCIRDGSPFPWCIVQDRPSGCGRYSPIGLFWWDKCVIDTPDNAPLPHADPPNDADAPLLVLPPPPLPVVAAQEGGKGTNESEVSPIKTDNGCTCKERFTNKGRVYDGSCIANDESGSPPWCHTQGGCGQFSFGESTFWDFCKCDNGTCPVGPLPLPSVGEAGSIGTETDCKCLREFTYKGRPYRNACIIPDDPTLPPWCPVSQEKCGRFAEGVGAWWDFCKCGDIQDPTGPCSAGDTPSAPPEEEADATTPPPEGDDVFVIEPSDGHDQVNGPRDDFVDVSVPVEPSRVSAGWLKDISHKCGVDLSLGCTSDDSETVYISTTLSVVVALNLPPIPMDTAGASASGAGGGAANNDAVMRQGETLFLACPFDSNAIDLTTAADSNGNHTETETETTGGGEAAGESFSSSELASLPLISLSWMETSLKKTLGDILLVSPESIEVLLCEPDGSEGGSQQQQQNARQLQLREALLASGPFRGLQDRDSDQPTSSSSVTPPPPATDTDVRRDDLYEEFAFDDPIVDYVNANVFIQVPSLKNFTVSRLLKDALDTRFLQSSLTSELTSIVKEQHLAAFESSDQSMPEVASPVALLIPAYDTSSSTQTPPKLTAAIAAATTAARPTEQQDLPTSPTPPRRAAPTTSTPLPRAAMGGKKEVKDTVASSLVDKDTAALQQQQQQHGNGSHSRLPAVQIDRDRRAGEESRRMFVKTLPIWLPIAGGLVFLLFVVPLIVLCVLKSCKGARKHKTAGKTKVVDRPSAQPQPHHQDKAAPVPLSMMGVAMGMMDRRTTTSTTQVDAPPSCSAAPGGCGGGGEDMDELGGHVSCEGVGVLISSDHLNVASAPKISVLSGGGDCDHDRDREPCADISVNDEHINAAIDTVVDIEFGSRDTARFG
ncbi:unnamed protein product [Vitrella brassicaformis CCMP3155]|uniref:Kringle domain-containing protein n=3 Tax=Vitrella brassicaformis TaxID=1169539 RepID=A0A0G4E8I4_VITBC|nr:unnamed protein product [Vitrella brassicaformis CCMP3155]|eukprot:CEL92083.1 unnamed protein product [Vitrella brassicaformis CCMP3155]